MHNFKNCWELGEPTLIPQIIARCTEMWKLVTKIPGVALGTHNYIDLVKLQTNAIARSSVPYRRIFKQTFISWKTTSASEGCFQLCHI